MDEYFEITRKIHHMMGDYTYQVLNKIEGVKTTRPEATFYLLANFNAYSDYFLANKISDSQKFSESFIQHPYHVALVGGDSLVLERTDFSARIAFVDYDGQRAMKNYLGSPPKTASDRIEFVKNNAPKIVDGLAMIQRYLTDLKTKSNSKISGRSLDFEEVTTP